MDYQSKSHAKFLILSHLIFVCNYRKKLLIHFGNETKGIFEGIAAHSDFSLETLENARKGFEKALLERANFLE